MVVLFKSILVLASVAGPGALMNESCFHVEFRKLFRRHQLSSKTTILSKSVYTQEMPQSQTADQPTAP